MDQGLRRTRRIGEPGGRNLGGMGGLVGPADRRGSRGKNGSVRLFKTVHKPLLR